ncbi:MAG: cupin domain-containing protein [Deltaproteobacteria bacterium]|nr:cupin domain-containing protein [Deltaproteobacteria bacterium]NIS76953.1 cupin domain-containing protein [Deltaproteobacteria bacterium]
MPERDRDESVDKIMEKIARERGAIEKEPVSDEIKVGEVIRKRREEAGLTVQDLAEKTGFSSAILTQIENRMISPPLGVIVEIANALNLGVSAFLSEGEEHDFSIVREKNRKIVSRVAMKDGAAEDYTYESLGAGKKGRNMEPFVVRLKPLGGRKPKLSVHHGEEFIYVLSGKVKVILHHYTDILEEGDSIYYNSSLPHHVHSAGHKEAVILAVINQGTGSQG